MCGTHIHISKGPKKHFSLDELKRIACGIVFYNFYIQNLIPKVRLRSEYCQANKVFRSDMGRIWNCQTKSELVDLVQSDRRVLWNFENARNFFDTGTIEFRGGPCMMNSKGTKAWVAFAVSFIQLCLSSKVR